MPAESLHDQIVKQWGHIRSYVLKDGHLYLSLTADGGIYEFEPVTKPSLTVKDYDDFYGIVILKAKNGTKDQWLASYDPVVSFISRVRQDVERLPDATQRALAKAVHDNGYWKGQEVRVRNATDPFVGAKLKAGDERLKAVLTPQGYDAYRSRYTQGSRGTVSPSRWPQIGPRYTGWRARISLACRRSRPIRPSSMPTRRAGMTWWLTPKAILTHASGWA